MAQASAGRPPAMPSGCRSARGMEPRWQPIGRLALQATVDSGSSGRSRSSREQAPQVPERLESVCWTLEPHQSSRQRAVGVETV